jgi:hypothetical protein
VGGGLLQQVFNTLKTITVQYIQVITGCFMHMKEGCCTKYTDVKKKILRKLTRKKSYKSSEKYIFSMSEK